MTCTKLPQMCTLGKLAFPLCQRFRILFKLDYLLLGSVTNFRFVLNCAGGGPHEPCRLEIDPDQLHAELADLHAELEVAVRNKNVTEEDYLEQIIAVSWDAAQTTPQSLSFLHGLQCYFAALILGDGKGAGRWP